MIYVTLTVFRFLHSIGTRYQNQINNPFAAMSPVFLQKMVKSKMVEAGEGVLAVEDMSGESMEQLLKHIYTGSVDKPSDLKVDVVLELLKASDKVEFKEYL
jgi:hypothetical protein